MSLYLGIDTSNYTTSVALYDDEKAIMLDEKMLLPVKQGECGIRQSDAVFHHTQQLPIVIDSLFSKTNSRDICAIAVSKTPRTAQGSYMPCFTAGFSLAQSLSTILNIPLYSFSHQQGHIVSALYGADMLCLLGQKFIAFHISGGTTEALLVDEKLNVQCIAKTLDLNAGQAIDRVGVMLGFSFPCGGELEKSALLYKGKINTKPTLKGDNCCLSGLQNICEKMYSNDKDKSEISAFCLKYIEDTVYQMAKSLQNKYKLPVLFAGGVMSNTIIKKNIKEKMDCYFTLPKFSTDNACGIAYLGSLGGKYGISNSHNS